LHVYNTSFQVNARNRESRSTKLSEKYKLSLLFQLEYLFSLFTHPQEFLSSVEN